MSFKRLQLNYSNRPCRTTGLVTASGMLMRGIPESLMKGDIAEIFDQLSPDDTDATRWYLSLKRSGILEHMQTCFRNVSTRIFGMLLASQILHEG